MLQQQNRYSSPDVADTGVSPSSSVADSSVADSNKTRALGVSVYHLHSVFLLDHVVTAANGSRSSTIYDLENLDDDNNLGVIRRLSVDRKCPVDGKPGAAYVHCLVGDDHVGPATHMLSYSWRYTIGDIVDTLVDYCETSGHNPKTTFIWICCLCINQHRVAEQKQRERSGTMMTMMEAPNSQSDTHKDYNIDSSAVDFFAEFGDRVARIGHVLAMMSPWNNPGYLQRIWCIFELYTTTQCSSTNNDSSSKDSGEKCKVTIVMPPREKLSLQQDLFGEDCRGVDALYEVLSKTRVQNAQASVEADRTAILAMVEKDPGYAFLNRRVNELLREWVRTAVQESVESKLHDGGGSSDMSALSTAMFFNRVCTLALKNAEYDTAMGKVERAIAILEKELATTQHPDNASIRLEYARCLQNRGEILLRRGQNDGAIATLLQSLTKLESEVGADDLETADTRDLIGSALYKNGDYDQSLDYLQKALTIRIRNLGTKHPDTAKSYEKLGHVLYYKGDYNGALLEYQRDLTICERVFGMHHPKTAKAVSNTGAALKHIGNYQRALKQHQRALAIVESVLGVEHPEASRAINNMGSVLFHMGKYDEALVEYQKALDLRQAIFGKEHPYIAASLYNVATVYEEMGDFDSALTKFQQAHAIQVQVLGEHHPNTATYQQRICAIQEKSKQR